MLLGERNHDERCMLIKCEYAARTGRVKQKPEINRMRLRAKMRI